MNNNMDIDMQDQKVKQIIIHKGKLFTTYMHVTTRVVLSHRKCSPTPAVVGFSQPWLNFLKVRGVRHEIAADRLEVATDFRLPRTVSWLPRTPCSSVKMQEGRASLWVEIFSLSSSSSSRLYITLTSAFTRGTQRKARDIVIHNIILLLTAS